MDKMAVLRYVLHFGDATVSSITYGEETFWLTKHGRVLVSQREMLKDDSYSDEFADIVKYIISGKNVCPAKYFEDLWKTSYTISEIEKAYNSVDTWNEPYEYDKAEGEEFAERAEGLMPLLRSENA